jgi:hypothetical protein
MICQGSVGKVPPVSSFEPTGDERRADFMAVYETKLRASDKAERDTHDGEPAIVIVKAGLGELDFSFDQTLRSLGDRIVLCLVKSVPREEGEVDLELRTNRGG